MEILLEKLASEQEESYLDELLPQMQSGLDEFSTEELAHLLDALGKWVHRRSNSSRLELVLRFIGEVNEGVGYAVQFQVPFKETVKLPDIFPKDLLIDGLSLVNTIVGKNCVEKYMRTIVLLMKLLSYAADQGSVAPLTRTKTSLKLLILLFRVKVEQSAKSEEDILLLCVLSSIIAKVSFAHNKCRDYLIRNSVVKHLLKLVTDEDLVQRSKDLIDDCLYALGSLAGSNDQQLLIWVSQGISVTLQLAEDPELFAACVFVVWRCCMDCVEIQKELIHKGFHHTCIAKFKGPLEITSKTFIVGFLRRVVAHEEVKESLDLEMVKLLVVELKYSVMHKIPLLLKELIATLGVLAVDVAKAELICQKNGVEILTEVALNLHDEGKVVKTAIGALVNLSIHGTLYAENIADRIGHNVKFYELLRTVLSQYKDSSYMLEYTLRLVLNSLRNKNCLFHFSSVLQVELFWSLVDVVLPRDELLHAFLSIFRVICSHSNKHVAEGIENVRTVVGPQFIDLLLKILSEKLGNLKIATTSFLLIATLLRDSTELNERSSLIAETIKAAINHYKTDSEAVTMITQCVASLPIEDLDLAF